MKKPSLLHITFGLLPLLGLFVAACAPTQHSIDHPIMCKEHIQMPCLSGSVCVEDEARGCEICKCIAPPFVPFDRKGPPGAIEVQNEEPAPATAAASVDQPPAEVVR